MDINRHIQSLSTSFNNRNGAQFAKDFGLPLSKDFDVNSLTTFVESVKRVNVNSLCNNKFNDSNLALAVSSHIDTLVALASNDLPQCKLYI